MFKNKSYKGKPIVDVIIPVLNEQDSIGHVISDIPKDVVRNIIVCDNGSKDKTADVASKNGSIVVSQPLRGYGNACLAGLAYIQSLDIKPDIVVFLDGDYSDYPEELSLLISPIVENQVDLVIGSRANPNVAKGSMTIQQRFGNWLATILIKFIYGYHFTDLGPFRAIAYHQLQKIDMQDKTYGWTVEMQIKAAKLKLKTYEIPVKYRKRIGVSKVSGTLKGTVLAGYKILHTIFRYI